MRGVFFKTVKQIFKRYVKWAGGNPCRLYCLGNIVCNGMINGMIVPCSEHQHKYIDLDQFPKGLVLTRNLGLLDKKQAEKLGLEYIAECGRLDIL